MTQIGFTREQAHEALDAFLNDPDKDHGGQAMARWISSGDSLDHQPVAAHIVSDEEWQQTVEGYHHWLDAEEQKAENDDLPPGYRPWQHSPLANTDRLLPHEPLHRPLSRYMFRKDFDELDQGQRDTITGAAIICLLRVTLDPDGQGAVPIMMMGHDHDEPGEPLRWQIAFATDVPGLYVRATANGWFGDEWGIVTGSGYKLAGGWYAKDDAAVCVAALGRLLPNVDWMQLTPRAFTPTAKAAIAATVKRYSPWSDETKREADPDPLDEAVPADSGLPDSEPAATAAK
jgi:hypothetical protein